MAELIGAREVAALLGKSHRAVIRLAHDGGIPVAQKLPGLRGPFLFDPAEVQRLAEASR